MKKFACAFLSRLMQKAKGKLCDKFLSLLLIPSREKIDTKHRKPALNDMKGKYLFRFFPPLWQLFFFVSFQQHQWEFYCKSFIDMASFSWICWELHDNVWNANFRGWKVAKFLISWQMLFCVGKIKLEKSFNSMKFWKIPTHLKSRPVLAKTQLRFSLRSYDCCIVFWS